MKKFKTKRRFKMGTVVGVMVFFVVLVLTTIIVEITMLVNDKIERKKDE